MGIFNDSEDVARGMMHMKRVNDSRAKQQAEKEAAAKEAAKRAQKSDEEKAKEGNLFI